METRATLAAATRAPAAVADRAAKQFGEKAPQRVIRSGRIFPIVRSGRAYGGLTSVLALSPCIFFVDWRRQNNSGCLS